MKAVTIDEDRIAARMKLVEEYCQAEMDLDLDRTLATLNDALNFKINNDEFSDRESCSWSICNLRGYWGAPPALSDARSRGRLHGRGRTWISQRLLYHFLRKQMETLSRSIGKMHPIPPSEAHRGPPQCLSILIQIRARDVRREIFWPDIESDRSSRLLVAENDTKALGTDSNPVVSDASGVGSDTFLQLYQTVDGSY
jgi:hypothetical protein